MATKMTKMVVTISPVVHFYMAEDLRQEVSGKVSAIGLYPDHVAILQIADDIPDPTESAPIFFKSMGFLFNVSRLTQATTIAIDIESGGERRPLTLAKEYPALEPGRSLNLLVIMEPCQVTSFGERTILVTVGESVRTFTYEIRRGSAPPTGLVPTPQKAVQKVPKSAPSARKKPTKAK